MSAAQAAVSEPWPPTASTRHIQSNRRRSIALLIGLFFLVYVMVYAGALVAEALTVDADSTCSCGAPGAI